MYWWQRAAELTRRGKLRRFGLITTNSLTQEFNRRVLQQHLAGSPSLSLAFAIPDHPWVDSADGAAVRIAMTVGRAAKEGIEGRLAIVTDEKGGDGEGVAVELATRPGVVHADLSVGANVANTVPLQANSCLSSRGVIPHGAGMLVTHDVATSLGLGRVLGMDRVLRPYRNGRDITSTPRALLVIDCYGLTTEEVRQNYPELFQWLLERVKPERDQERDKDLREKWWLHRRNNADLRRSLADLPRYVATVQTAKHRFFVFLNAAILPDDKLIAIGSDDA